MRVHMIKLESRVIRLKLEKIRIDGFKNILDSEIKLDKITSLLSTNSYGKSNLLEAIDFGFYFLNTTPKNKKQMMKWKPGFPFNKERLMQNFSFEIQCIMEINNKTFDVIFGYSFAWEGLKRKGKIVSEFLKIKDPEESQKHTLFVSRDEENSFYKPSVSGRCDKEIKIDENELIINKLLAYDNLYYFEIIKTLNSINIYIDRHFDSTQSYEFPFISKNDDELSISENKDIPRVLFFLQKRYPKKYELIINTLKDIFPFIEDIKIKEIDLTEENFKTKMLSEDDLFKIAEKMYLLYAKHKNLITSIRLNEMSDGVRRVLLLLTYLILADINNYTLIAIEEPENSINPGLLKKYIIALDNFVDNTKVLITSHSPFLVNYINPSSLYLGVPNENGLAIFRKIKSSSVSKIYDAAEDLNVLIGEYLFDLLSGETDDQELLNKYLENE